jgi:NADH-quinone oxidoreductase subunit G
VSWIVAARTSGKLPLLIVQGVLLTDLAKAGDVVLPGASWVEKDASYVNKDGRLQAAARAMGTSGEAKEDWKIFTEVALALGAAITYSSSAEIRAELVTAMAGNPTYQGLATLTFARPVSAKTWLQASNPSERWKWDFMFQDLPPVKFEGRHGLSSLLAAIPLKELK